ncbi:MAG TPA: hypothetical protein VKW08_07685 [Xanthobacteraceae bacterium]|nr:hypothetical protein [Xanthobacteraceae bacterium]
MENEVPNFPPGLAGLVVVGAAIAHITIWLFTRTSPEKTGGGDERERRLDALERDLNHRKEREEIDRDLADMRRDLEENLQKVIRALRDPLERKIGELERHVVALKEDVDTLRRRMRRRPAPKAKQPQ